MWSADQYLEKLYHETIQRHNYVYDESWQAELKSKVQQSLGSFEKGSGNFNPRIIEKSDMGSYFRLRVEISTINLIRMPVYLLLPKVKGEKKLPVVLALHGHGYGSKEAVGLEFDGSNKIEEGYHKNFAIKLVKKGVIVAVPELIGFGDRKLHEDQGIGSSTDNSCYRIASQLLLVGKTLAGLRVEECRCVIDYLQTLEAVDKEKIGCMGISGGGLVASFTSIVDERIKATVVSGYTNTFKGSIMDRRHCLDNYIPGILKYAEIPDLIGLIAPRPLFIESGTVDHLFPLEETLSAINKLSTIYQAFNAENLLASHIFEGGHEISGEQSIEWLVSKMKLAI